MRFYLMADSGSGVVYIGRVPGDEIVRDRSEARYWLTMRAAAKYRDDIGSWFGSFRWEVRT